MFQHLNSSGGRATVRRLSGYLAVLAASLLTIVSPGALAQTHVANPYVGALSYVSPDYAAEVNTAIAAQPAGSTLAGQMATVAKQPTFIWLDRIAAIAGGSVNSGRMSLQDHINAAVSQANGAEIVIGLVIYDLPDRDCAALASNGELSIAGNDIPKGYTTALSGTGIQEYENDYITPIYNIMAAAPSNVRFVLVIEDDSLPNLITNTGISDTDANCVAANDGVSNAGGQANWTQTATPDLKIPSTGVYYQGITYAANTFHKLPNAYSYLDIGHHGWLGWTSNTAYAVKFFSSFVQQMSAGYATIDGFITNTANYGPLKEPYLTWNENAGGSGTSTSNGIFTGDFYQWDPAIDEIDYGVYFMQALTASTSAGYTDPRGQAHTPGGGFPSTTGFLIDTSRNGWGNTSAANGGGSSNYKVRPTGPGTSTVIDTFVDESKIDLRNSSGQWCNQENAGIGELPTTSTGYSSTLPQLQAFVWVKPPGESDGNYPGSTYGGVTATDGDPNCNPVTANPQAGNDTIANSIPNPPSAGTFWLTEFVQLVQDAYPVLASPSGGGFTLTPASATETIAQGASATDAITVTDTGGFTGTVALTATSSNSGVTVSVSGNTLTINASSTATGTATISVTGTSGSTTATTSISVTVTSVVKPGFTLTPASATETLVQGTSATDAITVNATGGFTGTVALTATSSNSGVTVTVSGNTLTIKASSTATGTATISVTGTSGSITATTSIAVTVTPASKPGFTLTPASAAVTLVQGTSVTDAITVNATGGFTGTVALTASSSNSGVTVSVSGNTLTINASSTATGTATISVTGTSGSITATTSIAVTVTPVVKPGFTLTPASAAVTLVQGTSATDAITVNATGGFTGTVALTASSSNSGVTVTVSGNTLTIKASSTATGTATISVTGTSGSITATTSIAVTVTPAVKPGFTLTPASAAVTLVQGTSATDAITVNPTGGFTGTVALTASSSNSGVTVSVSGNTLTIKASSTATGTATISVTGTSGSITATTTITVTVTSVPPTSQCTVDYAISGQWPGGFGAGITIINNGSTAITNWTLSWSFANGQTISQLWNGTETQNGANVTVTNLSYNGSIPAGGTLNGIGFNGVWSGTNAVPTAISLNGTPCTVN